MDYLDGLGIYGVPERYKEIATINFHPLDSFALLSEGNLILSAATVIYDRSRHWTVTKFNLTRFE